MRIPTHQDKMDTWGIWANRLVRKKKLLSKIIWTFYARLKCFYWKINLGKGCHFWGKMHFQRVPESYVSIGDNCRFRSATWANLAGINRPCYLCTLRRGARITIGSKSGFSGTVISAAESIKIGSNVICGTNVTITDTDWHNLNFASEGFKPAASAPVIIGSNVWLGMNVTVLKGVTIGSNTIISANSTVTKDIPDNVLAGGLPAKILKKL